MRQCLSMELTVPPAIRAADVRVPDQPAAAPGAPRLPVPRAHAAGHVRQHDRVHPVLAKRGAWPPGPRPALPCCATPLLAMAIEVA